MLRDQADKVACQSGLCAPSVHSFTTSIQSPGVPTPMHSRLANSCLSTYVSRQHAACTTRYHTHYQVHNHAPLPLAHGMCSPTPPLYQSNEAPRVVSADHGTRISPAHVPGSTLRATVDEMPNVVANRNDGVRMQHIPHLEGLDLVSSAPGGPPDTTAPMAGEHSVFREAQARHYNCAPALRAGPPTEAPPAFTASRAYTRPSQFTLPPDGPSVISGRSTHS
jgi:hypothetical protein